MMRMAPADAHTPQSFFRGTSFPIWFTRTSQKWSSKSHTTSKTHLSMGSPHNCCRCEQILVSAPSERSWPSIMSLDSLQYSEDYRKFWGWLLNASSYQIRQKTSHLGGKQPQFPGPGGFQAPLFTAWHREMCCAAFEPTLRLGFITPFHWPALPKTSVRIWLCLAPSCSVSRLGCCQAQAGLQIACVFRKAAGPGAADTSQGKKTLRYPALPFFLQWHSSGHKGKSIQALTKRHFGDCQNGANWCWMSWQPVFGVVKDSGCATTYAHGWSWERPGCAGVSQGPSYIQAHSPQL